MHYSWELSPFDTDILGYTVAKISDIKALEKIKDLKKDLQSNNVRYATFRVNANNFPAIHCLEKNGFVLVDALITLETTVNSLELENFPKIKDATVDDLEKLKKIAVNLFPVSRYYHDPVIPKTKAAAVYKKWVENSVKGEVAEKVLVWKENKKILGLITLQKKGQIPLVGVSEKARGRGVGKTLVKAALQIFKDWGQTKVVIETQITNIPALRLYQSCGFKVIDSYLTFRWYDPGV